MKAASAPGKIITFYSYKGGTGRSMALANVAWVLASNGRRVLAVDWDLEAPGLHRYFYPFLVDKELTSSEGIIDFMINFQCEAFKINEATSADWYRPHANLEGYTASLDWEFPDNGTLDFVPAGRQTESYSARVNSFDWETFYDKFGGGVFLEAVKEQMRQEYDYILIDSRTGVSDAPGICTVQMPDVLAVCFTLNHQSIEGAAAVATSVYEQRRKSEPGIRIFPVPMRVDSGEKDKLELRREYARKQFERFPVHIPHDKRFDYWGEVEVIYVPYYAYEEILAPFGDKRGQTVSLLGSVERLTAYLTQDDLQGEVTRLLGPHEDERERILAEYAREALPTNGKAENDESAETVLVSTAETVFASFTPEQQAIARRVLSRLVRVPPPGEVETYARRRVKTSDLGTAAKPILDELLFHQLVLLGQDEATKEETVELAHDALGENWKRLRAWLAEDREFFLWRQGLQMNIAKWESTGRQEDALLHGAFLTEAERNWATRPDDLSEIENAFISQSIRARVTRREADQQSRLEMVKARLEKRRLGVRLTAVVAAMVLLIGLVAGYQLLFHRERTLTYLGFRPPLLDGMWSDNFLLYPDRKPEKALWDYPSDADWVIEKGEGDADDDGALLVKGNSVGVLNIQPKVLVDFKTEFKLRITQGTKAAWMFRVQSDKQSGYLFVLERDPQNHLLVIHGYVVTTPGNVQPLSKDGGHRIPFRGCCKDDDAYNVRAEVEGNEFRFWVAVESFVDPQAKTPTFDDRVDTGVEYFIEPFKDSRSVFPYGNFGLLEPDEASRFRVEYVRIWAEAGK